MNSLFITLKLETPLLITGVGNGEENSSQSLPYVPGSALRGALVSRFKGNSSDLPLDTKAGKLFFSGKVRFLNAYPLDQEGNRMLPVPASWRIEKGQEAKNTEAADLAFGSSEDKTKTIGKKFKGKTDQSVYLFSPEEEIAIHIASQNRGVVKAGESTVFQYQSLAREQKFGALIIAEDETDLDEIEKLLTPNTLYLGRSRSAGYGKVLIEKFQKIKGAEAESTTSPVVTITLLSDAILRDQHGQPTHDLDGYLSQHLKKIVKNQSAFIRPSEIGGFNRKWKLPLPQMPALGMGSVFTYPAEQLSTTDLANLVERGIGERCVDGFGRIAVNWHGAPEQALGEAKKPEPKREVTAKSHPLSPASQQVAIKMSERLVRHTLEQNLITEVEPYNVRGGITNHQLARLRSILRTAIDSKEKKFDEVNDFFPSLKETARKQWHNSRFYIDKSMAGVRLDLWMKERTEKCDGLALLKLGSEAEFQKVAGLSVKMDETLKREYTLRLMEAMIDHAMKSNKEA